MAVIAGNLELAEVIKNYKAEEIGELDLTSFSACLTRLYIKYYNYHLNIYVLTLILKQRIHSII